MAGNEVTWTTEMEVKLFRAMKGHKPVGEFNEYIYISNVYLKGSIEIVGVSV